MSQWGWHTQPNSQNGYYTMNDLTMTTYECKGRKVTYASEKRPGNEEVYDWLRQNPHRLNLGRIGLYRHSKEIKIQQLHSIKQELDLYQGILHSTFHVEDEAVQVETVCHYEQDVVGFKITSHALETGELTVKLTFPYGSSDITASNWKVEEAHSTNVQVFKDNYWYIRRKLDNDTYDVLLRLESQGRIVHTSAHEIEIKSAKNTMRFTVHFLKKAMDINKKNTYSFLELIKSSQQGWKLFWENGGMIDFSKAKDKRAGELERRVILSLYLLRVNDCGSLPPQETGLMCNSWYGKFHLEMYPWHLAWAPLWDRSDYILKSLKWFKKHLKEAQLNAKRNGYKGARWPKMVNESAIDSPSTIATLLIWQQPHLLYMLELIYTSSKEENLLEEYWELVYETAEFMCDFCVFNKETGKYDLCAPLIPAQEEYDPRITYNPTFEIAYWRFGLLIACKWAERIGRYEPQWKKVADHIADLPQFGEKYLAYEGCNDTFEKYAKDHPSMLGAYGFITDNRIDKKIVQSTYEKVMQCWDFQTMWGWDFALMAMTKIRLGDFKGAIDILLADTPKNAYVISGHNYQKTRTDLPAYLPGNGSILLVVAMMAAGYGTSIGSIFESEEWNIEIEGITPLPY